MDAPISPHIFDRLPDPTVILNPDGFIVTMNQAAVRFLETPVARAAGRRLDEFLPGLRQMALNETGAPQRTVIDWITPSQQHHLEVVISSWNNRQGELAGSLYVFHDLEFIEKNLATINQEHQANTSARLVQLNQTLARLETEYNLFAMVMDTINVLVAMLDAQGQITHYNRAFKLSIRPQAAPPPPEPHGVEQPPASLMGEPIWNLLYLSDLQPMTSLVHNLDDFLALNGQETCLPNADGTYRIITWAGQVYAGEDGSIEQVIVTGIDISAQKRVEELLAREQILLRSLINSIPDLIFYKDTQGRYLGSNLAFESFSQHGARKAIVGHTDFDFYPADVAEKFTHSDQQVMNTRQELIYENEIRRPNGETVILETRKSPYYGPHQEILGVIGIGRDITQHKLDEDALRQANAEIAQLIASLSSILIVIDQDETIQHWNPSARKILGVASEEAVGKRLGSLPLSWDASAIAAGIQACRQQRFAQFLDPMRFKRTQGDEGWLGINTSPIFSQDNGLSGFILLGSDITERKELENQVAQGQKLKSIGQLAAGIAHEINTPIQYIGDNAHFLQTSFADMIKMFALYQRLLEAVKAGQAPAALAAEIEEAVRTLDLAFLVSEIPLAIEQSLDGIQRVSEIVRSMKEFSYPGVVYKTAVDINKGLLNTITVARNEWKYVADVETDLAPDLPHVYCLPGEINQVFLNIIINAAQAIGEIVQKGSSARGKISIRSRQDGDFVEIRIQDSGPGIPEHVQQHIFEPFFTTKEVGKGTGQGLAIAYNVIEVKHGGKLSFETRSGEGATFVIRLPIQNQGQNVQANQLG